ncbi:MAG: thrombospondin type 3 repeat:Cna B-type [Alphaproteobacteria bacterium]|jgi:hypothetical protein|nr:thrombospondin type 3 repeat:Cna B-type [Alphaproteobacteria bacterium]MDP6515425.1 thrombospondin type 3 repeat:Cna B-type [Alphaproteobacteria bacterium]
MKQFLGTAMVLAMIAGWSPSGQAQWVIDFEDLNAAGDGLINHGRVIDTEWSSQIIGAGAGLGVEISATNLHSHCNHPDLAVAFDSHRTGTQDGDLEDPFYHVSDPGHDGPIFRPGNILIIQENHDGCSDGTCDRPDDEGSRPAGFFDFTFSAPVSLTSIDFFDVETEEDGGGPNNEIFFYDGTGAQIGATLYTPDTGGDNQWDRLTFSRTGVIRMVIEMGGSGAIDRIVGAATTQEVPEAGALSIMLTGLVGLALTRRRRSTTMGRHSPT